MTPDADWSAERVAKFPESWASRLLGAWRERHGRDRSGANLALLRYSRSIEAAQRAGIPADARDPELCDEADKSARDMARRVELGAKLVRDPLPVVETTARLWAAGDWLAVRGLSDAWERAQRAASSARAALARVCCARWWRLVLRRLHARAVESVARGIGLVHKRAGCYVSDDAAKRRRGQIARNAAALASVAAVNDRGQEYTLADLAARGPANREIRRHELMTRIAGFELVARELSHVALFVTVTCPGRMHAWRTKPGQSWATEANPHHDGTTPEAAQRYLTKQWARFRAAADRHGVELYGFRIAEPNHDGTPHWHALLFLSPIVGAGTLKNNPRAGRPVAARVTLRLLRRYFLRNDTPTERGARRHRVKAEAIDWTRGSAAGYVAKYVAKNIDGYRVERDLYGNEAMTASQRVEAWASTWRIRQFQQIGGAPVTVWRELRRLHPEQASASVGMAIALDAVNVAHSAPDAESEAVKTYTAAHGWATYLEAQGGHRVRRSMLRFRVLREATGELGRYGDPAPARAIGVEHREFERREVLGRVVRLPVRVGIESERCEWVMTPCSATEPEARAVALAAARAAALARGEAARPWSPVDNCTRAEQRIAFDRHPDALFTRRVRKLRRFADWTKPAKKQDRHGEGVAGSFNDPPKELSPWTGPPTPPITRSTH